MQENLMREKWAGFQIGPSFVGSTSDRCSIFDKIQERLWIEIIDIDLVLDIPGLRRPVDIYQDIRGLEATMIRTGLGVLQ